MEWTGIDLAEWVAVVNAVAQSLVVAVIPVVAEQDFGAVVAVKWAVVEAVR